MIVFRLTVFNVRRTADTVALWEELHDFLDESDRSNLTRNELNSTNSFLAGAIMRLWCKNWNKQLQKKAEWGEDFKIGW